MYDREVDVPRLTAYFDLDAGPEPDRPLPRAIREAVERVTARTGVTFNSVGLNLYRDGRDSVAAHNDHLNELVPGFPIALVSLGATRRMAIRAREPPRRALDVDLEGGSLLVMSYETQLHYTHGVPKTKARVGERISLAFRVRPGDDGSAGSARTGYYR
jgi:alkylated DNA repair dioxygenase AlkB